MAYADDDESLIEAEVLFLTCFFDIFSSKSLLSCHLSDFTCNSRKMDQFQIGIRLSSDATNLK